MSEKRHTIVEPMPSIDVQLIDHMGSDHSVVRAARVSFDKDNRLGRSENLPLSERDIRLVSYLAKHGHWTPFAHTSLTLYLRAPIFVARQLAKHQVGLVWNEVSRRYIDSDLEIYNFSDASLRSCSTDGKKQGSSSEPPESVQEVTALIELAAANSNRAYNQLLKLDVCPEQARSVLPLSTMTKWYWTGSLYAFNRVCALRSHATTQYETRLSAPKIASICSEMFPVSWKALSEQWSAKEPA